jgi:hypothetical protein
MQVMHRPNIISGNFDQGRPYQSNTNLQQSLDTIREERSSMYESIPVSAILKKGKFIDNPVIIEK